MAPTSEGREARAVDPRKLADVVLATAVRATCDTVFVEPAAANPDRYTISFERAREHVRTISVDAASGSAAVARLAFIAGVDLAAAHAQSAVVPVRSGDLRGEVVITIRPGDGLRAELIVVPSHEPVRTRPIATPTRIGDVIGNYRIVDLLGEGGMGTVYRVEHVVLGRSYALKVLRSRAFERDSVASQRFLREARAAARVRHPNIVDVFDFGHLSDGRPYLVMELLAGESLLDRVGRGPLTAHEVVTIARQIAHALAAVHDVGIIHADVTPSNALLLAGEPLQIKLVDFGLAAIAGERQVAEDSSFVLGTPAYISPEQLMGLAATDRSDQYSLGCVMFRLLAGHPPYEHEDLRAQCVMHVHGPIPVVYSPYGPLPPKLVDVVTTCLQKAPQARFPGMRALVSALDELERVTDRRGWRKWLTS